jgi:hypothetical protein
MRDPALLEVCAGLGRSRPPPEREARPVLKWSDLGGQEWEWEAPRGWLAQSLAGPGTCFNRPAREHGACLFRDTPSAPGPTGALGQRAAGGLR